MALVSQGNEFHPAQPGLIIVASLLRTLRQPDLVPAHALIWDLIQKMRDAIQPRPPFIVGADDMPGCMLRMGCLEHHIARPGIIVPASIRFNIHRAQLPLPQRILHPRLKAALLFVHPDLEPKLDQDNAPFDDVFLHLRTERKKALVFGWRTEAHHIFDAGAVVPAAVEDDDLAGSREMLYVTLQK